MEPSAVVNYENNCRLIYGYDISQLDSFDGKNLSVRGWMSWSDREKVVQAVLGTFEKIKMDMCREKPVWFFENVGETCPYSRLVSRTMKFLENQGSKLDEVTKLSLESSAKNVQDIFTGVNFDLSPVQQQRIALNNYVRDQVFPIAPKDRTPEGKLVTAETIITYVKAALPKGFVPGKNFVGRVDLQKIFDDTWRKEGM